MTYREATSQPATIYLVTNRGYLESGLLEWDGRTLNYEFVMPSDLVVNQTIVTHADGQVVLMTDPELTPMGKGKKFIVNLTVSESCTNPDCDCQQGT